MRSDTTVFTQIAVLVLNWNGRIHLESCLSALAAQTCQEFDLIVVDNHSTDDSLSWLRNQNVRCAEIVVLDENRGFSGGNAAGLIVVPKETEFVVLLNNDTAPEPDWLAALVGAAKADDRRGAIASLMVNWDGTAIDSAGDGLRVTGRGYQRFHGRPRRDAPASGRVFSASAGAALYRRAMLDEVGFLDERFFMNGEDTDLCFRARLAGWEVWYCAEAVVRHRVSASQVADSPLSVFLNQRNHLWSVTKCMPARLLWKYSWVHMLEQPARALFYARRGRFGAWLRGVLAGLGGIWSYREERHRVQTSRRVTAHAIDCYLVYPTHLGGRDEEVLPRA